MSSTDEGGGGGITEIAARTATAEQKPQLGYNEP